MFEVYNDYGQAAGSIRQQALPLAGAVLLIFLLLYLALFPVLRRTTRQLEYTNNELRRRAERPQREPRRARRDRAAPARDDRRP